MPSGQAPYNRKRMVGLTGQDLDPADQYGRDVLSRPDDRWGMGTTNRNIAGDSSSSFYRGRAQESLGGDRAGMQQAMQEMDDYEAAGNRLPDDIAQLRDLMMSDVSETSQTADEMMWLEMIGRWNAFKSGSEGPVPDRGPGYISAQNRYVDPPPNDTRHDMDREEFRNTYGPGKR